MYFISTFFISKNTTKSAKPHLRTFKRIKERTILSNEYDRDYSEYSGKVLALQVNQGRLKEHNFKAQLTKQRLPDNMEILGDNKTNKEDESIIKMLIDYIKVNSKNEIEFKFKCGLTAKESL